MEILSIGFALFIIGAPVGLGVFMVFFSRRFSLGSLQFRKAVWKIGFTDFDVRAGQVFGVAIGIVLLIAGFIVAAQLLIS